MGITLPNRTGLPTTMIRSYWELGDILHFDPDTAKRNMELGYYDTLRAFGRIRGCASAEKLYIAQDPAADRPNVKAQMADSSSQYHQVKTLIALRQAHSALHNRSDMRFVCDGAPGQALVYERLCEDEKLLVVINPNGKAASFDYAGTMGQPVYTVGGTAVQENGRITAAPVSAGIYRI